MMIVDITQQKNKLLDDVMKDLPIEKVNLFMLLDRPDFIERFDYEYDNGIEFKDFIAASLGYLHVTYPNKVYGHLFSAIVMDIFGDVEEWNKIPSSVFRRLKEHFLDVITDIEYQELPSNHIDFEMVYVMLETELEND